LIETIFQKNAYHADEKKNFAYLFAYYRFGRPQAAFCKAAQGLLAIYLPVI